MYSTAYKLVYSLVDTKCPAHFCSFTHKENTTRTKWQKCSGNRRPKVWLLSNSVNCWWCWMSIKHPPVVSAEFMMTCKCFSQLLMPLLTNLWYCFKCVDCAILGGAASRCKAPLQMCSSHCLLCFLTVYLHLVLFWEDHKERHTAEKTERGSSSVLLLTYCPPSKHTWGDKTSVLLASVN